MFDVVIIGGGYAGLAAGALLSHRGFRVRLLEKDKFLGGRARVEERDGYLLDYGMHSYRLGENGPLARVFQELGAPLQFIGPHRLSSYIFERGRLLELPDTLAGLLSTPLLKWREKSRMLVIIARMMGAGTERWYPQTLAEFLRIPLMTPGLRTLTGLMALTVMAESPDSVSAGEVIDLFRKAVFSQRKVGELAGGSAQIIGALQKILIASGEIIPGTRVTGFAFSSGRIRAALAGPYEHQARVFLFSAPISGLTGLVPRNLLPPEIAGFADRLVSTSGLSIDFGLAAPVTGILGAIFNQDPVVIGRFPSNIDPLRAPPGKQLSTWLRPIAFPITREKIEEAEKILRTVIEKIFPGFFSRVEWERKLVLPVMDGLSMQPGQDFPNRPTSSIASIPNLFLAGDTIQSKGSGGDIAFSSALSATGLIINYLRNSNS